MLGVGSFRHDCGEARVATAVPGTYYVCPSAGAGALCRPTTVPLEHQVSNSVAALDTRNNGVTIMVASVPRSGSATATGTLRFGVDARALRSARVLTMDRQGTLLTSFEGKSRPAVIDTGTMPMCLPASHSARARAMRRSTARASPAPPCVPQAATVVGRNGLSATVDFVIDNIDEIFSGQSLLPGRGAPSSEFIGGPQACSRGGCRSSSAARCTCCSAAANWTTSGDRPSGSDVHPPLGTGRMSLGPSSALCWNATSIPVPGPLADGVNMLPVCVGRPLRTGRQRRQGRQRGASWLEYLLIAGVVSVGMVLALTSGRQALEQGFCELRYRVRSLVANTSSIAVCGFLEGKPSRPAATSAGPPANPGKAASSR